jgi:hypothetical protein
MKSNTNAAMPGAESQCEREQWLLVVATGLLAAALTAVGMVSPLLGFQGTAPCRPIASTPDLAAAPRYLDGVEALQCSTRRTRAI